MEDMNKWGMILLGIWLIATGLIPILHISFQSSSIIIGLFALASGVLLILDGFKTKFSHNYGMMLLSIWLIVEGLHSVISFQFASEDILLGLIAAAAGILLLLKR
jgi:uncharacterized membrane protein HdeD (DUF308 family)